MLFESTKFHLECGVFAWGQGEDSCLRHGVGHGEDLSDQLLPMKIEQGARAGDSR